MRSAGHAFIAHTKALSSPGPAKGRGVRSPSPSARGPSGTPLLAGIVGAPPEAGRPARGARPCGAHVSRQQRTARRDHGTKAAGGAPRRSGPSLSVSRLPPPAVRHARVRVGSRRTRRGALPAEWHQPRPARLPVRLIPEQARAAGAWIRLRCDLSASSAARLQPSDLEPSPSDVAPAGLPEPALIITELQAGF
jgi:hypothetical protein